MLCIWGSRQIPVLETKTLYEHWSLSVRLFRKGKQQLGLPYLVTLNFEVFYILVYSRECVCVHYICCFYNLLSFYFDFIFSLQAYFDDEDEDLFGDYYFSKLPYVQCILVFAMYFDLYVCMCVCVCIYIYIYIYIYIVLCVKGITGAIKHLSFSHQIW